MTRQLGHPPIVDDTPSMEEQFGEVPAMPIEELKQLREILADFDAEVADAMESDSGERADLWDSIEVPVGIVRALAHPTPTAADTGEWLDKIRTIAKHANEYTGPQPADEIRMTAIAAIAAILASHPTAADTGLAGYPDNADFWMAERDIEFHKRVAAEGLVERLTAAEKDAHFWKANYNGFKAMAEAAEQREAAAREQIAALNAKWIAEADHAEAAQETIRAATIEECAKIAETFWNHGGPSHRLTTKIADAIHAAVTEACPFCGCDDETKMEFINSTTWCFQRCTNCGATGPRVCGGHGGDSRKAWDTRALSAQEEQIERLTKSEQNLLRILSGAHELISAIVGENQPDRAWATTVCGTIRAALEGSKRDGD